MTACRPIWCSMWRMVFALTGWPPTPSTSAAMLAALMSIYQTQPLDMTSSTCTQLLWSTMARPVLSGTCPVRPLYGLGHRAAAQFQSQGNLLIAYAILCRAQLLACALVGLMDRALDLKPEVTQGCGFESRLRQEVHDCSPGAAQSAAHCSKCVHLDGLNAENTFHSSLYSV